MKEQKKPKCCFTIGPDHRATVRMSKARPKCTHGYGCLGYLKRKSDSEVFIAPEGRERKCKIDVSSKAEHLALDEICITLIENDRIDLILILLRIYDIPYFTSHYIFGAITESKIDQFIRIFPKGCFAHTAIIDFNVYNNQTAPRWVWRGDLGQEGTKILLYLTRYLSPETLRYALSQFTVLHLTITAMSRELYDLPNAETYIDAISDKFLNNRDIERKPEITEYAYLYLAENCKPAEKVQLKYLRRPRWSRANYKFLDPKFKQAAFQLLCMMKYGKGSFILTHKDLTELMLSKLFEAHLDHLESRNKSINANFARIHATVWEDNPADYIEFKDECLNRYHINIRFELNTAPFLACMAEFCELSPESRKITDHGMFSYFTNVCNHVISNCKEIKEKFIYGHLDGIENIDQNRLRILNRIYEYCKAHNIKLSELKDEEIQHHIDIN